MTQFASETAGPLAMVLKSSLPQFPQTALAKLSALCTLFPPPMTLSPNQLATLMLSIHPVLVYSSFGAWVSLSRQTEEAGLSTLGSPQSDILQDATGLLGYSATVIECVDGETVRVTFVNLDGTQATIQAPARPKLLLPLSLDPKFSSLTSLLLFSPLPLAPPQPLFQYSLQCLGTK